MLTDAYIAALGLIAIFSFIYYIFFSNSKQAFQAIDTEKQKEDFRNYEDSERHDTVEAFYKEQHEKMTMEFVKAKRAKHLKFDKCVKTVWEMAEYLDTVTDDSDPDTDLSQLMHAIQAAEACRKAYPGDEYDWFHVTCFIHDLGKILLVNDPALGLEGDEQWNVVGDTFPVGCKFDEEGNVFPQYFKNNPDYNDKRYNTECGIYEPGCGLDNVMMSWGHDDYIYFISEKQSKLPLKALYMLRYHSFYPWHSKNKYGHLCNKQDWDNLKWVQCFNQFDLYSKNQDCPTIEEVAPYYKEKIEKYFPNPVEW